uniref:hypothetical protein n=4 Tax=unclassified Kineococcus TaxID=2621656 RepID=UPI003D7E361C
VGGSPRGGDPPTGVRVAGASRLAHLGAVAIADRVLVGGLLALLAVVLVTTAVRALRRSRRRGAGVRDDTLRAGRDPELDGSGAALRAMGRNAWMRPGGGGL